MAVKSLFRVDEGLRLGRDIGAMSLVFKGVCAAAYIKAKLRVEYPLDGRTAAPALAVERNARRKGAAT